MSSKRSTQSPRTSVNLEQAVAQIAENLAKLTHRLVGDEELQTKGLIHEVQENAALTRANQLEQDKVNRDVSEALAKLNGRMEGFDAFRAAQEAANKRYEETSEKVSTASNMALGGWKLIGVMVTVVTTCSGGVAWIISTFGGK